MSNISNLTLTNPIILEAMKDLYYSDMFHQNATLTSRITHLQNEDKALKEDIKYLEETCRIYFQYVSHP